MAGQKQIVCLSVCRSCTQVHDAGSIQSRQGNLMKYGSVATMAAFIVAAAMAPVAHAQTKPVQSWQPGQHEQPDPAKRVPEASQQADPEAQPVAQPPSTAVQPPQYVAQQPVPTHHEENRGGFFLGVQGGKGWVYEDVDQSALAVNAGYRWQAGAVSLIGIELASGRLDGTEDDGLAYGKVEYASIGANARFNFGRTNPVYGLVRAGYWAAEDDELGMDVDGAYFGVGLGVDVTRNFNLSLVYTNHVYFNDWEGNGLEYDDVNRADTLMFGAEARF